MKSIKGELFHAFLVVISALAIIGIGFLLVHAYVVEKYKNTVDTTVQERQLLTVASDLTNVYNTLYLNSNTNTTSAEQQLAQAKSTIKSITNHLNTAIVDNQSKADYISLKNTINALVGGINTSLDHLERGNIADYTTDYNYITKLYGYVQDNDTNLIFSQLDYINSISAGLNRTYELSELLGIGALVVLGCGSIVYSIRFARRLTRPLSQLTSVAEKISGGATEVPIESDLLGRQDEIGSLANSFSVMLDKLNANLAALTQQNTIIEKKVVERTSQLMREQARLASSVQSMPLGYIMTDVAQKVILINDAAELILSYKITQQGISKSVKGSARRSWTTDDFEQLFKTSFSFKDSLAQVISRKQSIERNGIEYNGRVLRIFITQIVEDSRAIGAVVLLEDITEEVVAERSKDEFFSIASHELRTPLTAIRGNSDMIRQFYGEKMNDADFTEMINDIHSSSVRLISIVNDFLDVSRLEQGKLKLSLHPFDVSPTIEEIIEDMTTMAQAKQNKLNIINPGKKHPQVFADKDRFKQIIYNLIGNAMKLTEAGTITIETVTADKMLKVLVSDTGPGISEQNQRVLFHKFQQASSSILTRDSSQSTGLGLYISRLLANKMGGDVKLERSQLGKGATFSCAVPLYVGQVWSSSPEKETQPANTDLSAADKPSHSVQR
jgi:signal transduction histidine kinase/HAMP domain-containing protein